MGTLADALNTLALATKTAVPVLSQSVAGCCASRYQTQFRQEQSLAKNRQSLNLAKVKFDLGQTMGGFLQSRLIQYRRAILDGSCVWAEEIETRLTANLLFDSLNMVQPTSSGPKPSIELVKRLREALRRRD